MSLKMTSAICRRFVLLLSFIVVVVTKMSAAGTIAPSTGASRNVFAADIFGKIAASEPEKNIIFSPASIQSCVTLAFFGAEGQTAEEMRNGLKLGALDKTEIAKNYGKFLKSTFDTTSSAEAPLLKMANRIYVNTGLEISPKFNEIATKYFNSQAEQVQFSDPKTVNKINNWVEEQTQHKIKNLMAPGSVNGDTSSVLINAIYFKGKWDKPFSKSSTHKADFSTNSKQKVSVDMMYTDDRFKYAELSDLDATALELPYKESEISMLIILPKKVDGLKELENKLANIDLNLISEKLTVEDVDVHLPKFTIEFDIDLRKTLEKLGMTTMFSDRADFSSLFTTTTPQKISDVKHKAFIDVNEAGSEAAAATYLKIVPMSLNLRQKAFRADHPFLFAIRSKDTVYFAGHVAKF